MIFRKPQGRSSFTVGGGVALPQDLANNALGQMSPAWSAQYGFQFSGKGWSALLGTRWEELTWSSQTTFEQPVNLYRPGTVDTIFRNLTTGEERIVTRDSIPGLRRTDFQGFGWLTVFSLPVGIGKSWSLGRHKPSGWMSMAPSWVAKRNGRFGDPERGLSSLEGSDLFPSRFWWTAEVGVDYHYKLSQRWWLGGQAAVRTTLTDQYFNGEAGARVIWSGAGISIRWELR